MTQPKPADCGRRARQQTPPPKPLPELPAWKAFVIQFTRDTGTQAGTFSGRVEHLSSGRRARFDSTDDLVGILNAMLAEVGSAPDSDCLPE